MSWAGLGLVDWLIESVGWLKYLELCECECGGCRTRAPESIRLYLTNKDGSTCTACVSRTCTGCLLDASDEPLVINDRQNVGGSPPNLFSIFEEFYSADLR